MYIDHLRRWLIRFINIIYRRLRILTKPYFKVVFFILFFLLLCEPLCGSFRGQQCITHNWDNSSPICQHERSDADRQYPALNPLSASHVSWTYHFCMSDFVSMNSFEQTAALYAFHILVYIAVSSVNIILTKLCPTHLQHIASSKNGKQPVLKWWKRPNGY